MGSFGSSRHPPKPTPVEMVTTSEYFLASLGALDCDDAALEKWCPRTYTEHLIDEASGEYVLTARCQQPKQEVDSDGNLNRLFEFRSPALTAGS